MTHHLSLEPWTGTIYAIGYAIGAHTVAVCDTCAERIPVYTTPPCRTWSGACTHAEVSVSDGDDGRTTTISCLLCGAHALDYAPVRPPHREADVLRRVGSWCESRVEPV